MAGARARVATSSSRATRTSRASPRRRSLSAHRTRRCADADGDFLARSRPFGQRRNARLGRATGRPARARRSVDATAATRATLSVIRGTPNVSAYAARGHALCLSDDFDQGLKHLKEALRLDPDCGRCGIQAMKKAAPLFLAAANAATPSRRRFFHETLALADVRQIALFAAVVSERAQASLRLRLYEEALAVCDLAIAAREDHKRACCVAGWCDRSGGRARRRASGVPAEWTRQATRSTTRRRCSRRATRAAGTTRWGVVGGRCPRSSEVQGGACSGTRTDEHRRGKTGGTQLQGARGGAGDHGGPHEAQALRRGYDKGHRGARRGGAYALWRHGCGGGGSG